MRVNRHGISVRASPNGALMALAADPLGLCADTAVRWVTYARRDRADYLAGRLAQDHEQSAGR
jgi:hypothetical protein